MTEGFLYRLSPVPPPYSRAEIDRYMGAKRNDPATEELVEKCLSECENVLRYSLCYRIFSCKATADSVSFAGCEIPSADLAKNLAGCQKIALIAATVGLGIDRLITKYSAISPATALCLQAIGAERVESMLDAFEEEWIKNGAMLRPRFSPGYGDFPLAFQREIFRILDCPKTLGLTLNDSLLMSPSKSVTAVLGLLPTDRDEKGDPV